MKKLLFIYNPHAGRGQVRGKLADILNAFTRPESWAPSLTALPAREETAPFMRW